MSIMKNISSAQHAIGIPVRSPRKLLSYEQSDSKHLLTSQHSNDSSLTKQMRLGPRITEVLKWKLGLGAKFLQVGRAAKTFKHNFSVIEGEKLVKAFRCHLITTAGPFTGLLFISTHKVSFCSERRIKIFSPMGESVKIHYKVVIPLVSIQKARESQDSKLESKKYLEIVTTDNYDFWFTGFHNHQRMFECIQQAASLAHQWLTLEPKIDH